MADAEGGEDNSWKFGVAFVGEQIRIHQQGWQYLSTCFNYGA